ncbi:MAG: tetratricopeptide repeat protein, partial [Elainellaceae cyanobacterium]
LAINIDYGDRYSQARTYHNLGSVAQAQRQWQQANDYYNQALAIKIDFGDRYSQASTYHQMGSVAQEQRQWQQANDYYNQALAIKIEYGDRYSQAMTYSQLGLLAEAQDDWPTAAKLHLEDLRISVEFKNEARLQGITGQSIARIYRAQRDETFLTQAAEILEQNIDELRQAILSQNADDEA